MKELAEYIKSHLKPHTISTVVLKNNGFGDFIVITDPDKYKKVQIESGFFFKYVVTLTAFGSEGAILKIWGDRMSGERSLLLSFINDNVITDTSEEGLKKEKEALKNK